MRLPINQVYIFDTDVILYILMTDPPISPVLQKEIENAINKGTIISVTEVKHELKKYGNEQVTEWVKRNKELFTPPNEEEQRFVISILKTDEGQALIKEQTLKQKDSVADPWIIAKAKIENGTVVTMEKRTTTNDKFPLHQGKIPDICTKQNIPCINLEEFMKEKKSKS